MSSSVRPHRWQLTRLPCPWGSPGKNTGVGCHFLLQCMKVKSESELAQSCPTPSDPMDCSLPGSSIHEIFQAEYWSGVPLPSLWVWMRLSVFTVQILPLPSPSVFLSCTYSWFQEYSLNGPHAHHLRICFLENPTCQRWDASPNRDASTLFQGGHYYLTRWSVQTIHCRKTITHLSSVLTTRTQPPSLSID